MNKGKKVAIIATVIVVIGIIIAIVIYRNNWPLRFSKELNRFFGEGNWEYTSKETKESIMFNERRRNSATNTTTYVPGHYKNWEIEVNRNNKKEYWIISNHAYKINHDKHWFLSPKLYSAKEALILELMNISEEIVAEKFKEEILNDLYSKKEVECFDVTLMYHGGNHKPSFYKELYKQDWFTASKVNAKNYLETDLYDFYLYIRIFDYRLEKLTEEEQQNLLATREKLEQKLLEEYGDNASFEIYFADGNKVEYVNGERIKEK